MGIPSLNSAIFYIISLYFNLSSRETSRHHANITNTRTTSTKTAVFMDDRFIFPFRQSPEPYPEKGLREMT